MDFKTMSENHKSFWIKMSEIKIIDYAGYTFSAFKDEMFINIYPSVDKKVNFVSCFLCPYDKTYSCPGTKDFKCTDGVKDGCLDGLYVKVLSAFHYQKQKNIQSIVLK